MGYNNIIDSLTSKRVNEGMMTSIKKNTVNKEMKSIIDALLSHNVKKLNKKDLAVDIPMLYNQVGFSKGVGKYLIFTDSSPRDIYDVEVNGYKVDDEFYYGITFLYGSVLRPLGKTLLYKCDNEEAFKAYGDSIKKHGFTSTGDIPKTMYKRGLVYYNIGEDEFLDDKDKVVDIIFSYCSDILVKDLVKYGKGNAKSVLSEFSVFDSAKFDVHTPETGVATHVSLLLYSKDNATLQSFYDDILSKLPTSKYSIMISAYDFLHITFPF